MTDQEKRRPETLAGFVGWNRMAEVVVEVVVVLMVEKFVSGPLRRRQRRAKIPSIATATHLLEGEVSHHATRDEWNGTC